MAKHDHLTRSMIKIVIESKCRTEDAQLRQQQIKSLRNTGALANNDNRYTPRRRQTVPIIPPSESVSQVKKKVTTAELNTTKGSRNGSTKNLIITEQHGQVMGFRPIQCRNGSTKNRIMKEQQGQVIESHTLLRKGKVSKSYQRRRHTIPAKSQVLVANESLKGSKKKVPAIPTWQWKPDPPIAADDDSTSSVYSSSSTLRRCNIKKPVQVTRKSVHFLSSLPLKKLLPLPREVRNRQAMYADAAKSSSASAACVTDIIDDQYQVGQTLRVEHHAVPFTSAEDASHHLSKLPLGSPLFVKRTSGEWTYASIVERQVKDGDSLIVSLDMKSDSHKILNRDCWVRCLRLVSSSAIKSTATATTADTTSSSLSRPEHGDHTSVNDSACDGTMNQDDWSSGRNSTHSRHNRNSDKNTTSVNCSAASVNTSHCNTSIANKSLTSPSSDIGSSSLCIQMPLCYNEKMNINTSLSSHRTMLTNDSQDSTNNLTRSATELSTTTSTVNLNAKTFIGKRRDRFRPRAKQRFNSVPNLLSGLDSLPAV